MSAKILSEDEVAQLAHDAKVRGRALYEAAQAVMLMEGSVVSKTDARDAIVGLVALADPIE